MITTPAISGCRSLRHAAVALEPLTVVTGANGSLYRSLRRLADIAHGNVIRALAHEGGLDSVLWAGKGSGGQVSLKLDFTDDDYGYAIDLGLPIPNDLSHSIAIRVRAAG